MPSMSYLAFLRVHGGKFDTDHFVHLIARYLPEIPLPLLLVHISAVCHTVSITIEPNLPV